MSLLAVCACARAANPPVTLMIENAAAAPLRCMLLLAHFVTIDIGAIEAGRSRAVAVFRDRAAGTLWLPNAAGRPMMIEQAICGETARWSETRGDISLLPLRASPATAFATRCHVDTRLACAAPAPTN